MKNSKFHEYQSGGKLFTQILRVANKENRKAGIEALLEAGRWLCRWCHEFNAIGDVQCTGCKMPRADYET